MSVTSNVFSGHVLEEELELSLAELSQTCSANAEWLMSLVAEGIIDPLPGDHHWRFNGASVYRVRRVQRLQDDLGVNVAGAALAIELLEEIERLRNRLHCQKIDQAERT